MISTALPIAVVCAVPACAATGCATARANPPSEAEPLEVLHGGYVMQGDVYLQQRGKRKKPLLGDPLTLLYEHVKNSNLRLWDLFAQFDKDKSLSISREEFQNGMKVRDGRVVSGCAV